MVACIQGKACQNTSIDTGAARPPVRAYASSYASLPKLDMRGVSRATALGTHARTHTHAHTRSHAHAHTATHENVPTNALHMPRFHSDATASSANAVVLILWYACARSVALLTHAHSELVTRHIHAYTVHQSHTDMHAH